jgi:predicted TIM-barrel fold metal-dependent hydrolase
MMKLIDMTVYYGKWPDWPIKYNSPDGLVEQMDRWEIAQAIVASTRSVFLNCQDGHQEIQDLVAKYPERFIGFAIVSPKDGDKALSQVETVHRNGLKGLRLLPQHHQYRLDDDPILADILTLAQKLGMPVQIPCRIMLHWGLPQLDVREIDGIAARFPGLRIMTGGLNYSELRDLIGVMRRQANVTFETSCMQMYNGIETLVEKVGADRIFFGSGMLLQYPSPGIAKITHAQISDEDKEKILGLNAERWLGL